MQQSQRKLVAASLRDDRAGTELEEVLRRVKDWLTYSGQLRASPLPLAAHLEPAHRVPADWWQAPTAGEFKPSARSPHRSESLPRLAGHWKAASGGAQRLVYGINGPSPTLLLDGPQLREVLIHDPKGPGTSVRPLLPQEAWRLHGGTDDG